MIPYDLENRANQGHNSRKETKVSFMTDSSFTKNPEGNIGKGNSESNLSIFVCGLPVVA